jgi:hypothetical protein
MLDVFSSVIDTYTLSLRLLQESSSSGRWTYLVLYYYFKIGDKCYLNTYTCIDNHLNAGEGGGGKMSVHSSNCLAPIAGLQWLLDNHKDFN